MEQKSNLAIISKELASSEAECVRLRAEAAAARRAHSIAVNELQSARHTELALRIDNDLLNDALQRLQGQWLALLTDAHTLRAELPVVEETVGSDGSL